MIRFAVVLVALLAPFQEPTEKDRRSYVEKNVEPAIEKGLKALRELQQSSGAFESALTQSGVPHGLTALALYTFLSSGVPLEDPAAGKALDWLLDNQILTRSSRHVTYETSLRAVALSYALPHLPKGKRRESASALLQRSVDWLVAAQVDGGGWSYDLGGRGDGHDHSNGQFAVLGLRAAANAGVKIPKGVWEREVTHYKTSQLKDGGWGYTTCYPSRSLRGQSTSTMTAAGVMGLAMALASSGATRADRLASDTAIRKGLAAMQAQWRLGKAQYLKSLGGVAYLLYSVERACMVTGQTHLGNIDWYLEGAWQLIREQTPAGMFEMGYDPVATHCFSLLFLKRAFVPVATPSNSKPESVAQQPGSDANEGKPREME